VFEEKFKHLHAKTSPSFGKNTMVRNGFIQVITKKPSVGHIDLKLSHQPSFRGYTVKKANEKGLKENNGVYGWLAGVAVVGSSDRINEGEIDR
jgi:hypothetical protein